MSAHRFNARQAGTGGRPIRRGSSVQPRSDVRSQFPDICDARKRDDSQGPVDPATNAPGVVID
ncbi:hypothetical protein [Natrialba sp. SSL1]|uniref:hypothetical protein n=1 Tax=Natrialba sp. SSL1 TaxID=1869245 RepID=UPI0008F95168|nr:hypothetical protein [Natrialba sp. SSL1]OIB57153.1 hypothetical protein BBD46_15585 [Natrialba sp. SSL1]